MNYLWQLTFDDYIEICKRAKKKGIKPGEPMQDVFVEYMKEKNIKPIGATELNKNEFIKEYVSHDKKILDIETDKKGKQKFRFIKKKDKK
jgi:hypothetical protein